MSIKVTKNEGRPRGRKNLRVKRANAGVTRGGPNRRTIQIKEGEVRSTKVESNRKEVRNRVSKTKGIYGVLRVRDARPD